MSWYGLMPTNKFVFIGFALMLVGFFTLPFLIGLLIMPAGILLFVFGVHKAYFDSGKFFYNLYKKFKNKKPF